MAAQLYDDLVFTDEDFTGFAASLNAESGVDADVDQSAGNNTIAGSENGPATALQQSTRAYDNLGVEVAARPYSEPLQGGAHFAAGHSGTPHDRRLENPDSVFAPLPNTGAHNTLGGEFAAPHATVNPAWLSRDYVPSEEPTNESDSNWLFGDIGDWGHYQPLEVRAQDPAAGYSGAIPVAVSEATASAAGTSGFSNNAGIGIPQPLLGAFTQQQVTAQPGPVVLPPARRLDPGAPYNGGAPNLRQEMPADQRAGNGVPVAGPAELQPQQPPVKRPRIGPVSSLQQLTVPAHREKRRDTIRPRGPQRAARAATARAASATPATNAEDATVRDVAAANEVVAGPAPPATPPKPGNRVGQKKGLPQAIRYHKNRCKDFVAGCGLDCLFRNDHPEEYAKWLRKPLTKQELEGTRLPPQYRVKLWAHIG